jgi:hypothetical protein
MEEPEDEEEEPGEDPPTVLSYNVDKVRCVKPSHGPQHPTPLPRARSPCLCSIASLGWRKYAYNVHPPPGWCRPFTSPSAPSTTLLGNSKDDWDGKEVRCLGEVRCGSREASGGGKVE